MSGLDWSEMGPLVVPRLLPRLFGAGNGKSGLLELGSSDEASFGSQDLAIVPRPDGGMSVQSVAVGGQVRYGQTVLGAWAQAENGDGLSDRERRRLQWSLSALHTLQPDNGGKKKAGGGGSAWGAEKLSLGLALGKAHPDIVLGDVDSAEGDNIAGAGHLQVEAFARWEVGGGLVVQPGVVMVGGAHGRHSAYMLRTSWSL